MERSCTRGANILATFWRPLGSITEVTKWLMDHILGITNIGGSLNHVHKIRGIGEILHGIVHSPSQLIPREVKYAKTFLIWCHPIKEIGSVVPQSGGISHLGINGGLKELVEVVVVWIELICLALYSQITARKHERELLGLVLILIVHGSVPFILRAKSQEPRESHVIYGALVPLCCPSDCVVIGVVVVRTMELRKNFLVPIVPKPHKIIETTSLHFSITELNTVLLSSS
jgi:hypothetical protein